MSHAPVPTEIAQCIDDCLACHRACLDTVIHCLKLGGHHASVGHVQVLLDCAQICTTTAAFLLRFSPRHHHACTVCAEICDECAASCESFVGDAAMAACAKACRTCAASCRAAAPIALSA